jgi:hypothetical protein
MFESLRGKKWIGVLSGLLLTVSAAGCGGRVGQVSGKVRYAGRPLSGGTIVLLDSAGKPHHGQIGTDGSFQIADVSLGTARVGVSSLRESAQPGRQAANVFPGRVNQPAAVYSSIPVLYGDLDLSGLTVLVEKESKLELDLQ